MFQKRLRPLTGDVLLTIVGTIGRAAIVEEQRDLVFQRSVCVLRTNADRLLPNYLRFALESPSVQQQLVRETHQSAQGGVYLEALNDVEIPLRPLAEQQRVVDILERADRLRRLRRYALELSDAFLPAVFLEIFGDPRTSSHNFDTGSIDDVVQSCQYGTSERSNPDRRGYPVLGMGNITSTGEVDLTEFAYVDLPEADFVSLRLQRDDIIFNRTNSTELVGKTACWRSDMEAVLASYLVRIRLRAAVHPLFFVALLNTAYFKELFRLRCKKAVGQSNISPTLLKEFRIFVPPLSLQERFARLAERHDVLRKRQREALRQADHLFQSVLRRAFPLGRWRPSMSGGISKSENP